MKPYRIVIFIFAIITVLAVIAAFFPEEGITLGNVTLRFPTLESVMVRNTDPEIKSVDELLMQKDTVAEKLLQEKRDTIRYYESVLTTQKGRFYLPDDDLTYFDDLFRNMRQACSKNRLIRVLHYGDSQIEMDRISCDLRDFFQNEFGGGGPGMLPFKQSVATTSVSQYASGEVDDYAIYGTSMRSNDKEYGIMSRFYRMQGSATFNASASKSNKAYPRLKQFSRITLLFKDHKGSFSATLKDRTHNLQFEYKNDSAGLCSFVWELDTPADKISISMKGHADIYGIMVDDGCGVAVDNIPIRGASGTFFSQIERHSLAQMYGMADVGLIILQFGGNSVPGIYNEKGVETFKQRIASQIRHFRNIYPRAKILFIGPSDMSTRVGGSLRTYPMLPAIVDALKEAAVENDAAYWDLYEVMGGENSMLSWVKNGYAANDYIHFSSGGATKIGKALSDTFSEMYRFYLTRMDMPKNELSTSLKEMP